MADIWTMVTQKQARSFATAFNAGYMATCDLISHEVTGTPVRKVGKSREQELRETLLSRDKPLTVEEAMRFLAGL